LCAFGVVDLFSPCLFFDDYEDDDYVDMTMINDNDYHDHAYNSAVYGITDAKGARGEIASCSKLPASFV
jgi:hypothetical protein